MSALFKVRVIEKKRNCVKFELTIINPDQKSFYNTKSFALLLLTDRFLLDRDLHGALLAVLPRSELESYNLDLIRASERKVIKRVMLSDVQNYPPPQSLDTMNDKEFRAFWEDETRLPRATLQVCVNDPAWIEHINPNERWESAAFNIV
jgi:hypothetical protein